MRKVDRPLRVEAADVAEPRRCVVDLLLRELAGARDSVAADDQVDPRAVGILEAGTHEAARGIPDIHAAAEAALVSETTWPVTWNTAPWTAGTLRSPSVSAQPATHAFGLLKMRAHTVTAWPSSSPDLLTETLMPAGGANERRARAGYVRDEGMAGTDREDAAGAGFRAGRDRWR
jgi:hypothetical protein